MRVDITLLLYQHMGQPYSICEQRIKQQQRLFFPKIMQFVEINASSTVTLIYFYDNMLFSTRQSYIIFIKTISLVCFKLLYQLHICLETILATSCLFLRLQRLYSQQVPGEAKESVLHSLSLHYYRYSQSFHVVNFYTTN